MKHTSNVGKPFAQIMDVSIKVTIFYLRIHTPDAAKEHFAANDKPETSK